MSRSFAPLAVWLSSLSACALGSGHARTVETDLDPHDAVVVASFLDVTMRADRPAGSLSVTCDDNLFDLLRIEVVDGVLELGRLDGPAVVPRTPCVAELGATPLGAVRVSGAGSFRTEVAQDGLTDAVVSGSGSLELDGVSADQLSVRVSGSGDVAIADLAAEDVAVSVSGSGTVRLRGVADALDVHVSGSGDLEASQLTVRTAEVSISGSGDAVFEATETVQGVVSGSGDLVVSGPALVDVTVTGSGTVHAD